jgi:hypothetical protein
MARTAATVVDLETGNLPMICAKTGEEADLLAPVEFTNTPSWTWILLLFGFFPWLIARHFATERMVGHVPLSNTALRREQWCGRAWWVFLGLAIALIAVGLITGNAVPAEIGLGTLVGWLIFAILVWVFVTPRGYLSGEWVQFSFVNPRFAAEVDAWYERRAASV